MAPRTRFAAVLAAFLLAVVPGVASADDEGSSHRAYDLVRQAIALIVNTPGDMDAVGDKIKDAIAAEDPSNVQIPLVEQAQQAADAGDMHQARALLERSIGARVHTDPAEPVPIGEPARATGADTGTVAAVDAMPGRSGLNGGDWVMLAVSIVVGLAGAVLSARLRPTRVR